MRLTTYYEKSDSVLWALTPDGIVLHNFAASRYLELRGLEQVIWSYLDGAHTVGDVTSTLAEAASRAEQPDVDLKQLVKRVVDELKSGGFIKEISHGK